ncbi:MAG: hypothetical protein ACXAAH_08340 [Promethearchaeota archaeon]
MAYTIADGKFPRKPEYGNVLEACRKDFRKFKDLEENEISESFFKRIVPSTQVVIDPKIIFTQKENIENIRKLIKVGREDVAFSLFFKTFPSCLPHRSNR